MCIVYGRSMIDVEVCAFNGRGAFMTAESLLRKIITSCRRHSLERNTPIDAVQLDPI